METEWRNETTYPSTVEVYRAYWTKIPQVGDRDYLESDDAGVVSFDWGKTWVEVPTKQIPVVEVIHRYWKSRPSGASYQTSETKSVNWLGPSLPKEGSEINVYWDMAKGYAPACPKGQRIQVEWRQPPIPKGKRKLPPAEKTGELRVV